MEIECKIISNDSKGTKLQGAVLCIVQTELSQMFCTLNIKVSPSEGHSSTYKEAEPQEVFPLEHRLFATENSLPDLRYQWAEKKSQMQTFQEYVQNMGHTHHHLPEYCLT